MTMTLALTQEQYLFRVQESVRPGHECFKSGIYWSVKRLKRFVDDIEMLGIINSCRPIFAAAPAAQGKKSFLYYLGARGKSTRAGAYRVVHVSLTPEAGATRTHAANTLTKVLECPSRANQAINLVRNSAVIKRNADDRVGTLLLIDVHAMVPNDVVDWLCDGLFHLHTQYFDYLDKLRVQVAVTGSFHLLTLCSGASSRFPLAEEMLICDFSREQTVELIEEVSRSSGRNGFRFDDNAVEAVYQNTNGDKYFTNLLASCCVSESNRTDGDGNRLVDQDVVANVAQQFEKGVIYEPYIMPILASTLDNDREVADAVARLCEVGGSCWQGLSEATKSRLFQIGAVGLKQSLPVPTEKQYTEPRRFEIRNPMLRKFAASFLRGLPQLRPHSSIPTMVIDTIYYHAVDSIQNPARKCIPVFERGTQALKFVLKSARSCGGLSIDDALRALSDDLPNDGYLSILTVNTAVYTTRRPLSSHVECVSENEWIYTVDVLSPTFTGHGTTADEAKVDLRDVIHTTFQRLVGLRPFRMTDVQKLQWGLLEEVFDVDQYRRATPVVLKEIGILQSTIPGGRRCVVWIDGMEREHVGIDAVPNELAAMRSGEYFEAIVERDRETGQLRRVTYARLIDPPAGLGSSAVQEWLDSLPGSESLPKSVTDLTTL